MTVPRGAAHDRATSLLPNVCFTSKSGHRLSAAGCPLCAKSGREQVQQMACGNARLVDHLVGASKERLRNAQTERLGSFEIDDQFVFGRHLHWQVGGLLSVEDAIDVAGRAPVQVDKVRPIGN